MLTRRCLGAALGIICFLLIAASVRGAAPPPASYAHGAVATDNQLASLAGVEILQQGGNAIDAACAAAFTLGVVSPSGSGIGGGGFMLIRRAGDERPLFLDFRETAPAAASRDMYAAPGVAADASRSGGLAVAVPGEIAGCAEAIQRYGRLSLARVLAPAIRHARAGFPVGIHLARTIASHQREVLADPGLRGELTARGKLLELGDKLRRPALAKTLETVARHGAAAFYSGPIGRALVEAVREHGGILTVEDLARYRVKWRDPLEARYRGYTLHVAPPPSSGGVALIETVQLLERYSLKPLGQNSSSHLHLLAEAMKHAFADRSRFLGDPDFVRVPVEILTARWYADQLAKRIADHTGRTEQYGSRELPRAPSGGKGGTSHLSVVDRFGNAVAMTTTINGPFGAQFVAGSTGILLNNEMDDFAARPGKPNLFGLVQGEQNAVAPGKRPLSSMCPTIVTREGRLVMVAGASGGPTIISGTIQAVLNVLDFGLDAPAAVYRSRVHHQWLPDELVIEDELPADVIAALRKRGHKMVMSEPFTAVQVVVVVGDKLQPASDPRKAGVAAGY